MKILLVDHDRQLTHLISSTLKQAHHVIEIAQGGQQALDLIRQDVYDLILLDVVLPDINGIEVCRILRSQGDRTPVLILTNKDQIQDKVAGLDAGADDYLVKPFDPDELAARVRALIRRESEKVTLLLTHGGLVFDPVSRHLSYHGKTIHLRPKELAIVELMLRYPTQIFDADALLDRLWPLADCPGKATIKAHILSLRKQLKAVGAPDIIETLYGQGYRLNPTYVMQEHEANPQSLLDSRVEPMQLTSSAQISHQTWQQVQPMTWSRLTQLKDLLAGTPDCLKLTKALELAHQLHRTLGTFGFEKAAVYAKCIEVQLAETSSVDPQVLALLQGQVEILSQNLRQQVDHHPLAANLLSTDEAQVLAILRDRRWGAQLWQIGQDFPFHINICTPLNLNYYLLEKPPQVILMEFSLTQFPMNSTLLDMLRNSYNSDVPILAVIEGQQPDLVSRVIQKGVTMVLSKDWSLRTLLTVISEYVPLSDQNTEGLDWDKSF